MPGVDGRGFRVAYHFLGTNDSFTVFSPTMEKISKPAVLGSYILDVSGVTGDPLAR